MPDQNSLTAEGLNHLIIIANDGHQGFKLAAEYATDPLLKAVLAKYGTERAEFVIELKALVANTGTEPESGGGPVAALHRVWMDVKAAFVTDDNRSVLKECIKGDQAAISAYETVLRECILTDEQSHVLQRQLKLIRDSLFLLEQDLERVED